MPLVRADSVSDAAPISAWSATRAGNGRPGGFTCAAPLTRLSGESLVRDFALVARGSGALAAGLITSPPCKT